MEPTKQPFTIGIICNGYNDADILYYVKEFRLINRLFKDRVRLLFIGYNPESNILDGINYDYTKPVSINHFFKHLKAMKVDMLFIPAVQSVYNESSENYNKFAEAAIFGIPIITVSQYPYNIIIKDLNNGFLYESRETFIEYIKDLLGKKLHTIKVCGMNALETHLQYLSYDKNTVPSLIEAFD